MKILFVINSLEIGGAERMLAKLAENNTFANDKILVVTLLGPGALDKDILDSCHDLICLSLSRNPRTWTGFTKLVKTITEFDPDIIHSWLYYSDLAVALACFFSGHRSLVWSIRQSNLDKKHNTLGTQICIKLCAALSHYVPKAIIGNSKKAISSHVNAGYNEAKTISIPNGFDLSAFRLVPQSERTLRRELGISEESPLAGMVGRFHSQKNHRGFFQAAKIISQAIPETRFCLVGSGITSDNPLITQAIADAGLNKNHVHLMGQRTDIANIMSSLDVFLLSSSGESFPNVVGESMACETPVVATNVGDCVEIIGETGRLAAPNDPIQMADHVIELLSMSKQEREAIGHSARERVISKFDIDDIAQQYRSVYLQNSKKARE